MHARVERRAGGRSLLPTVGLLRGVLLLLVALRSVALRRVVLRRIVLRRVVLLLRRGLAVRGRLRLPWLLILVDRLLRLLLRVTLLLRIAARRGVLLLRLLVILLHVVLRHCDVLLRRAGRASSRNQAWGKL